LQKREGERNPLRIHSGPKKPPPAKKPIGKEKEWSSFEKLGTRPQKELIPQEKGGTWTRRRHLPKKTLRKGGPSRVEACTDKPRGLGKGEGGTSSGRGEGRRYGGPKRQKRTDQEKK